MTILWTLLGLVTTSIAPTRVESTGFEGITPGTLSSVETPVGIWSARPGHAVIDAAHHRSGERCLHVVGGDAHEVRLELSAADPLERELSFWCERWTRRDPFEFRVERFAEGAWEEVYRGDDEVTIGTFKSHVRCMLPGGTRRLRFRCTSPSGVLIDDVALVRPAPMVVRSVTAAQPVVPCLVGNEVNRVAEVRILTEGSLEPVAVAEIRVNLAGTTDLADVASVEVLGPGGVRFGTAQPAAETLVFRGDCALGAMNNVFVVSATLASGANIDHVVDAGCDGVVLSSGGLVVPENANPPGAQRLGIALRDVGDDGSAAYRIPGITTTNAGTLVAVYDVRWDGRGDLPGDIDVGMSRSVDGGRTWQPMKVILDMGDDKAPRRDGVGDPTILYDRIGGTIWVAATWSHGDRAWHGSGPGVTPDETGQMMLVRSDDDGLTWSAPINITKDVKEPEWCYLLPGPGRGICMADGTLVFAAQYQDTEANGRIPRSTILYSHDRGETWSLGTGPLVNTTEAQVVEIGDGELMLNMRDNRGGSRAIYTTRDLGKTWKEHATSRSALVEPVCNAALLSAGGERLVFVNPAVPKGPRRRMTMKLSMDAGASWPASLELLLDEGASAGYPSATMIEDGTVGVLFEGSAAQLTFMRVPLASFGG